MFTLDASLLDKIRSAIQPRELAFAGPHLMASCPSCRGNCGQACYGTCAGSCQGTCTRTCKFSSR